MRLDVPPTQASREVVELEQAAKDALIGGVQGNLKKTLDSYSKNDEKLALSVWSSDKEIDVIINKLLEDLLNHMKNEKKNIESLTHLLFIAKNIERIGDHSTNICEYVHFLIKGEDIKGDRPKG